MNPIFCDFSGGGGSGPTVPHPSGSAHDMATCYQELLFFVLLWMCRHVNVNQIFFKCFPLVVKIRHRIEILKLFEGDHPRIIPVKFGNFPHIV